MGQLTSTTGVLVRPVLDLDDFAGNPDTYLVDLYADEDAGARAWLRVGERHHFRYNDGIVAHTWQGTPVLGDPMWDDICGIWHRLTAVTRGYLSTGRGEASFPDQPSPLILEQIRGGALFTIDDTKVRVEPVSFCSELLDEAERFWRWTDRHGIPVEAAYGLHDIERIGP